MVLSSRSLNGSALRSAALALVLGASGCGAGLVATADGGAGADGGPGGDGGGAPSPDMALPRPPLGEAITAPKNTWTWVDFPDAHCDDGTTTGIGVSPGDGNNVLVFLNGGGACWDYATCYLLNTAAHGPFGAAEFARLAANLNGGGGRSALDRGAPGNPFKDWNLVFVPYCTGDVHSGDNIASYTGAGGTRMHHHVGHANLVAYFKRLAATFHDPDKLVLSGSSAGGFGAGFNYPLAREYWPGGKAYLLDDSGPPLKGDAIPKTFRDAWWTNWALDKTVGKFCPECQGDFSLLVGVYAQKFPSDRMALLSSLQDQTIRGYFALGPDSFQTALLDAAATVYEPTANFRYFFVPGQSHTMLGDIGSFRSNGVTLTDWLTKFVADDPAWVSTRP